jgi:hypothetical protein
VEYIARMKKLRSAYATLAGNAERTETSSGGQCCCVLLIPASGPSSVGSIIWLKSLLYEGSSDALRRKHLRSSSSTVLGWPCSFANNL